MMAQMGDRRRSSSISLPDELIVIKPPTEYLADEYDISNQLPTVHVFYCDQKREVVTRFKEALEHHKYVVPVENEHNLLGVGSDLLVTLDKIRDNAANYSGIILFFCGIYEKEGHLVGQTDNRPKHIPLVDIWSKFTSYNCEHLRDKPKIFIFQLFKPSLIQTDSVERFKYDASAEADMVIIYNTENEDFIEDFSDYIQQYGAQEEILCLASVAGNEFNSKVVSTLTKKFYLVHNETRGHISQVHQCNTEISEVLKDVTVKMDAMILAKDKSSRPSTLTSRVVSRVNSLMKINSSADKQKTNKKNLTKTGPVASTSKVVDGKPKVTKTEAIEERKTLQRKKARRRNSSTSSANEVNRNTNTRTKK